MNNDEFIAELKKLSLADLAGMLVVIGKLLELKSSQLEVAGQCTSNSTDPACPDCGAVDCERAKSSSRECSSGFEPGQRKVCSRCGRMNCDTL